MADMADVDGAKRPEFVRPRRLWLSAHQTSATWALSLALAAAYLWRHETQPLRPLRAVLSDGWWTWADQGRYLVAPKPGPSACSTPRVIGTCPDTP